MMRQEDLLGKYYKGETTDEEETVLKSQIFDRRI